MAKDKENEQEQKNQSTSLIGQIKESVQNISAPGRAEQLQAWEEKVSQPATTPSSGEKIGGGLLKARENFDEEGNYQRQYEAPVSTQTPGGLFEKISNTVSSGAEEAKTNPSLFEKYGRNVSEETTTAPAAAEIKRQNTPFEQDRHKWGADAGIGSKRNETNQDDDAYHWDGHYDEDGNFVSGLAEWAADNQERISSGIDRYNETVNKGLYHTEEEVQAEQQEWANLYYDCGELEEYQQKVVEDFKAKYDQTYASASDEEKKDLDDQLGVYEHNLEVYKSWKSDAKEMYDRWSGLNEAYDTVDDNKKADVTDPKYYQERGLDGEYLYGGDTPENILKDIENTRVWADLQEAQLKKDTASGQYTPSQLAKKKAVIDEERARAKDLEDHALKDATKRKEDLEKKNANLELERKYIFTSKLEEWQNAAVNLNKDLDAAKKAGNESEIARIENELLFVNDKADVLTKYDLEKKYYAKNEDGSYAFSNEDLNKRIAELSPKEAAKQEKKTAPVRTAKEIEAEILALSPSKDGDKIYALRQELESLGKNTVETKEPATEESVAEEKKELTDAEKWELDLLLEIRDERELEEKFKTYVKDSGLDQAVAAKKFYDESNAALDEAFQRVSEDRTLKQLSGPAGMVYVPDVEEHWAAYDEARKQASYASLMYQRSLANDKDYAKNVEAGKKNAPGIDKLYGTFSEIDKSNEGASKVNLGKLAGLGITGEAADRVCLYLSTMGVTANDILPRTAATTKGEKATNMYAFDKTARLWTQDELDSYYSLWGKGDIEGAMDYALRLNSSISSSYHDQIKQNMINAKLFAAETNKSGAITEALIDPWITNPLNITALGDWFATTDQVNRLGVDVMHNKFTPYQLSNLVTEVNSTVVRDTAKHPEFASLLYGAYNSGVGSVESALVGGAIGSGVSAALGVGSEAVIFGDDLAQAIARGYTSLSFFGSAAASSYEEFKERGVDPNKAWAAALASGLAEAFFEDFSFDKVYDAIKGNRVFTGFLPVTANLLVGSGIEMSEEALTEMANFMSENIILGKDSKFWINVNNYHDNQGMNYGAALKKALADEGKDVGLAMASAFFSTMGSQGAPTYINYAKYVSETSEQAKSYGKKITEVPEEVKDLGKKMGEFYSDFQLIKEGEGLKLTKTQQKNLDTLHGLAEKAKSGTATEKELGQLVMLARKMDEDTFYNFVKDNVGAWAYVSVGDVSSARDIAQAAVIGKENVQALRLAQMLNPGVAIEDEFVDGLRKATGIEHEDALAVETLLSTILTGSKTKTEEELRAEIEKTFTNDAVKEYVRNYVTERIQQYRSGESGTIFPWAITTTEDKLTDDFTQTMVNIWDGVQRSAEADRIFNEAVAQSKLEATTMKRTTLAKYRDPGDLFVAKGPDGQLHIFTREYYLEQHKKGIDPLTGEKSPFADLVDTDDKINADFDRQLRATIGSGGRAEMVRYNLRTGEEKSAEEIKKMQDLVKGINTIPDVNAFDLQKEIADIDKQLEALYSDAELAKARGDLRNQEQDDAIKNLEARKAKAEADLNILKERAKVRENDRERTRNGGTSGRNDNADERRTAGGIPIREAGSGQAGESAGQSTDRQGSERPSGSGVQQKEVVLKDGDTDVVTMDGGTVIYDSDDPKANTDKLISAEKDVLDLAKEAGVDRLIFVDSDQMYANGTKAAGYFVTIDGKKTIIVNCNRGAVQGYHEAMHYCLDSYEEAEKNNLLLDFMVSVFGSKEAGTEFFNKYNTEIHQSAYQALYAEYEKGNKAKYTYALFEEMLCDLWKGLNRYNISEEQFNDLRNKAFAFVTEKQIIEHAKAKANQKTGAKKSEEKKTVIPPANKTKEKNTLADFLTGERKQNDSIEAMFGNLMYKLRFLGDEVEGDHSTARYALFTKDADDKYHKVGEFYADELGTEISKQQTEFSHKYGLSVPDSAQTWDSVLKRIEAIRASYSGTESTTETETEEQPAEQPEEQPAPTLDTTVGENKLKAARETIRGYSNEELERQMEEIADLLNQLPKNHPDRILLEPIANMMVDEYTDRLAAGTIELKKEKMVVSSNPAEDLPVDNTTDTAGGLVVDTDQTTVETEESTEESTGNPLKDELSSIEKEIEEINDSIEDVKKDRDRQVKEAANKDERDIIKGQANNVIKILKGQIADLEKRATAIRGKLLKESQRKKVDERDSVREANETKGSKKKPHHTAETHIDNRELDSVGKTNVNAFQYDNPEIKPFYKRAAEILMRDLMYLQTTKRNEYNKGTYFEADTDFLEAVRKNFESITDAIAACDAVIHDKGGENYVGPKRIEIFLDQMLTNGYTPINLDSEAIEPSLEYINLKGSLEGGTPFNARERAIDNIRIAYLEDGLTDEELGKIVDENKARTGYYDPETKDYQEELGTTEPETTEQPVQAGRTVEEIDAEMDKVLAEIEGLIGQIDNATGNVSKDKYAELNDRLREREAYYNALQDELKEANANGRFSTDEYSAPDIYGKFSLESVANGTGLEVLYQITESNKLTTLEDWITDMQNQPRDPDEPMPTRDSLQEDFSWKVKNGKIRVYGAARRNADGSVTGMQIDQIKSEDMRNSPLGFLVASAEEAGRISKEEAERQYDFLRDLTRLLFNYHDKGLIWEVVGSEMFAAIKSNSDPQYNRTIDFSTICKKTQAVIDAVGMTMQLLNTGLSKDEIKLVYKLVGEAGESTPCPVCYVFSRWMGLGSVLDNIKRYQVLYGDTAEGGKERALALVKEVQRAAEEKIAERPDLTFGKAVNAAQKDVELRLKIAESAFNDYEKALKNPNAKKYKGRNITTDENGNPRSQDYWAEQISDLAKEYDKFDAYKWAVKTRLINADLLLKNANAIAAKFSKMGIQGETLDEILQNAFNSGNTDDDFVELRDELKGNLEDLQIVDEDRMAELRRKQELRKQQTALKAAVTREFGKEFTNSLKKLSNIEKALEENPDSKALRDLYENRKEFDSIGEEYVFRKNYRDVPDNVLFDLNQGEKFARYYPATWSYRTTRGSGLGKAIMPYSDARVGEIIQGMALSDVKNIQIGKDNNAFLNLFIPEKKEEAMKLLANARKKMAAQNLIGGMRFQSTSDFRYEYASDYLLAFFEMQAMGANVQLYTKVLEAVDFFANVGCDVNLSVMPRDKGIGELTEKPADWETNYDRYYVKKNGKYVRLKKSDTVPEFKPNKYHAILYSDVTGVNGGAAREYVNKYDNVQMIMVGISADHINACLDSDDITFVIPFHGSGNSTKDIQQLMQLLGETIDAKNITDFTSYQTDVEKEKISPARDLRKKIVSGGCLISGRITITRDEANILNSNPFLKDLFRRFYLDATDRNSNIDYAESEKNRENVIILDVHEDGTTSVNTEYKLDFGKVNDRAFAKKYYLDGRNECYGNFLSGATANQIFPYEYWDKSLKQSEAKGNGDAFQEYCKSLGLIPRFSGWAKGKYSSKNDFTKNDNYWKLLIDRKMYDNQGNYRAQRQIDLSNIDAFRYSDENYEGDRRVAITDLNPNYGQVNFGNDSEFANRVNPKVNGRKDNSVISKINDPRKTKAIATIATKIINEARDKSDSRAKRRLFADTEDIRQAIDAGDYITAARMLIDDPGTRFFEKNGSLFVETDEGTMRVEKNGDLIPVEGKFSTDMLDTSVLERYRQEELIDLAEWDFTEHPNLNPELTQRMQDAMALRSRVLNYFNNVDEDDSNYLSPDEIDALLAFNLYNGNRDWDNMPRAYDLVYTLSERSKEQSGADKEETYQLMADIIPHLSTDEADRWTESSFYNHPSNEDFYEWYTERHPTEEVGYHRAEKYSADDAAYMQAVNSNDLYTAQRLVNEAALNSGVFTNDRGRPLKLYHGTPHFGFTTFRDGYIYMTTSSSISAGYTTPGNWSRVRRISEAYTPEDGNPETFFNNAKNVLGYSVSPVDENVRTEIINRNAERAKNLETEIQEAWTSEALEVLNELAKRDGYNTANEWYKNDPEAAFANAISWVLDLPSQVSTYINDLSNPDYREETVKLLKESASYFEKNYEELRSFISEHRKEITNTPALGIAKAVLGYDLADLAIYMEGEVFRSMQDGAVYITDVGTSEIRSREQLNALVEESKDLGSYELYAYQGNNPLTVDANGAFWSFIKTDAFGKEEVLTTDDIAKRAKEAGYTSVIIKNVIDPGSGSPQNILADDYIVFDPGMVKSADPVTYDDDGNVIPLSERFNPENRDMRYSVDDQIIEDFSSWLNWDTSSNGYLSHKDYEAAFSSYPETDFFKKMVDAGWLGDSTKSVEKEFQDFVSKLDDFSREKLFNTFDNYIEGSLVAWDRYYNTSNKTLDKYKNKLKSILAKEIDKKGYSSLTKEQLDAYRPDYIAAIQQMYDRDEKGVFIADDPWHKSHQALYDLFQKHPELDYLKRLAYATTKGEKDRIRAEFEQLLSGIDDRNALWQLASYSIYPTLGRWNGGQLVPGEYDKVKSTKRLFSNIIEKRRDQILAAAGESSNVKLQAREYTLQEIRDMFDQLNRDEQLVPLADKIFTVADRLGLTIRGRKGDAFEKSTYQGQFLGSVAEYNINRFNDLGITDQSKASTLLHELVHACTQYAIRDYEISNKLNLTPEMRDAVRQLVDIYNNIKADPELTKAFAYRTSNVHEMMAGLTDPKFREALEKKNLWQRIVDAIKKFFGIDTQNALDAASTALDYLLDNFDYDAYLQYAKRVNKYMDKNPAPLTQRAEDAVNAYQQSLHPGKVKTFDGFWVNPEYAEQDSDGTWYMRPGYSVKSNTGEVIRYDEATGRYVPAESESQQDSFMLNGIDVYDNYVIDGFFNSNGDKVTVGKFSADDGILSVTYFAGAGTLDYALRDRLFPIYAVEYEPEIRDMFIKNNGNSIMVMDADVNEVVPGTVIAGHVPYFHASPVCTNFSIANNKHGETERDRQFARSIAKALRKWKIDVFTLENVKGYLGSDSLKIVTDALDELGYKWDVDVYRASDYGASTIRDRLFVRAVLNGELPPKPTKTGSTSWWGAVKDIIDTLPVMDDSGLTDARRSRLEKMGIDINNLEQPILLLSGTKSGEIQYAYADQPSPTLMTDGSEARIILTDGTILKVTPRVFARIQGLDDNFQFPTQKRNPEKIHQSNAFKIVGNGIPTQLTQAIVNPLLDTIDKGNTGRFSVDIESGMAFDQFGDELALDNYNPTDLTQSALSENLYYSADESTAYYQTPTGETVVLENLGADSPEARYINYLEAMNNANNTDTTAAKSYLIPPANRNGYSGYNLGEQNAGLRSGAQEVLTENQKGTLRSAGSYGELYEEGRSQSEEPQSVGKFSTDSGHAFMYDADSDTFVNEDGDVVATDDVYPIGSFTREVFKAMKAGDQSLKSVEDLINQLFDRKYNIYEEDVNTVRRMIQINDAYTKEQREAMLKAMDELVKKHGKMRSAAEDLKQDLHFAVQRDQGDTIDDPNDPKKKITRKEFVKRATEGKDPFTGKDGAEKMTEKEANKLFDKQGTVIMKYTQTVARNAEQEWLTDEMVREALTNEAMSYAPVPNDKAIRLAEERLRRAGSYEKALAEWDGLVHSERTPKQVDVAFGELLLQSAAEQGRINDAVKLASDLTIMAHTTGQTLQAFRILKKLTPRGQLYYMTNVVEELNKRYDSRIKNGKMSKVVLKQELVEQLLSSSTREELDTAIELIKKDLAQQIPATWADQWNAWRYLAMLGNPRTHIRNLLGNAAFMPAVFTKDMIARRLENKYVDPKLRMRLAGADLSKNSAYRQRAEQDFKVMAKIIAGEASGNKYSDIQDILGERDVFAWKWLNDLARFNGGKLSDEDMGFMHTYYTRAFAEALQARGIKEEDVQNFDTTPEGRKILNEIRNWACMEAQRNTYHDANKLASLLNQMKRSSPAAYVLLEGLAPFTKTPANILKRGIEYSPIGLISSYIQLGRDLRSGEYSTSQCIDRMAAGWTGTGLMILGFILSKFGLLRGGGPDDDKEAAFEKLQGHQNWAIEIPWFDGRKFSYTLDWMAPSALPLFVGQQIYSMLKNGGVDLTDADTWMVLTRIADPLLSLSMLDGIENTLTSLSNAQNTSALGVLWTSMAGSYLAQGMPTIFGQAARIIDPYRRQTFVPEDAKSSALKKWVQSSIQAKLPGFGSLVGLDLLPSEENKKLYVDMWGRTKDSSSIPETLWRIAENFVSPGYHSWVDATPVDQELQRLYEATGEKSALPGYLQKSIGNQNQGKDDEGNDIIIDGKKLTADEMTKYEMTVGQNKYQLLSDIFATEEYQQATDTEKLKMVTDAYSYAKDLGDRTIIPEREHDSHWMEVAEKIGASDYIVLRQEYEDNKSNEKIFSWLASNPNLTEDQVATLIADKFNPPDNVSSISSDGFIYDLNGQDEDIIKEVNEQIIRDGLRELLASDEYKNAPDKDVRLKQFYEDARTETLKVYGEMLDQTDRVKYVGKAASIGAESFDMVLNLTKDDVKGNFNSDIEAQSYWLGQKYKADASINNPLHEGYSIELDKTQKSRLESRFRDRWNEEYDELLHSEKFQNAPSKEYQDDMIARRFNQVVAEVEEEFASELYQAGGYTEIFGKPGSFKWEKAYEIADRELSTPQERAEWLAGKYSPGSSIADPDQSAYEIPLTAEDKNQLKKEFKSAYTARYVKMVTDPAFKALDPTTQEYKKEELRKDVASAVETAYARRLKADGYASVVYDDSANLASKYEYLASNDLSDDEKIQIIKDSYVGGTIANAEARGYRKKMFDEWMDNPANTKSYLEMNTADGYEKMRKAADKYAGNLTKQKYGNVKNYGDIENEDLYDVYYTTNTPIDSTPPVKINEKATTKTDSGALIKPGNIDLNARPIERNSDGTYSTVDSVTWEVDGQFVNVPTVIYVDGEEINGEWVEGWVHVDGDTALDHYFETGEHLGIYKDEASAVKAAQQLSKDQAKQYNSKANGYVIPPNKSNPLLLNHNDLQYTNYELENYKWDNGKIVEGVAPTQAEYDQEYLDKGYYPARTGETRVLEEWHPEGEEPQIWEIVSDSIQGLPHDYEAVDGWEDMAFDVAQEYYTAWLTHPDYEGQSFEDWLASNPDYTDTYTRAYHGVGQKATRREALNYNIAQAVGGTSYANSIMSRNFWSNLIRR